MSVVQAFYHIVINTKYRKMTLPLSTSERLYNYIVGISRNHQTYVLAINGIENHLHMLVNLSPKMALSDYVREVKRSSSLWLKQDPAFSAFEGWGKEYFAISVSRSNCNAIRQYIANQCTHHQRRDFDSELKHFIESIGEDWRDDLLT